MIIGDRIRLCLEALGKSQADLARAISVSPQAISKMVNGGTTDTAKLYQIARFLETTPEYLTGETDDPSIGSGVSDRRPEYRGPAPQPEPEHVERAQIVWLKEVDQVLGAGGGFFDDVAEERLVPFPAHWLRNHPQSRLEFLVTMPCKGTSMEPTIMDGNLCIIDTSRTRLDEQDEIWACAFGNLAVLKRLRAMPDGTVKLMSDNKAVSDEIASDGELFILGRCVNVLRST